MRTLAPNSLLLLLLVVGAGGAQTPAPASPPFEVQAARPEDCPTPCPLPCPTPCPADCAVEACPPARRGAHRPTRVVVELSKPEVHFVKSNCGPSEGPCRSGAGMGCAAGGAAEQGRWFNFNCTKIRNRYVGGAAAAPAGLAPSVQTISVPSFATAMVPVTYQYQITRGAVTGGELAQFGETRARVGSALGRQEIAEIAREVADQLRDNGGRAERADRPERAADNCTCPGLEKRVQELDGRIQRLETQVERILKKLPGQ